VATLYNRARVTTASVGTGTITLGAAIAGYFTFAEAGVQDADVVAYTIEDGSDFEIGTGTYTASGTTLTRTVTESKIGGVAGTSAINLSGNATVFITARAEDIGDVTGPASSTDNAIARYDSTTGKIIQNSSVTIDDSDNVSGMATLTLPNTGLHLLDTNASHDLIIAPGSDLTVDRTLTVTTGDADRTLTLSGNATVSQDYSTTGNPQFGTIELGHASDTTLTRVSAGVAAIEGSNILLASGLGSITQAFDADTLKADTADVLTAGFAHTVDNDGTQSTGTYTPTETTGNMKRIVNGGAFTLAPPTNDCTIIVQITNNVSAGAITTTGFSGVFGDAFTTTNGDDFICSIIKINGFSSLTVQNVS